MKVVPHTFEIDDNALIHKALNQGEIYASNHDYEKKHAFADVFARFIDSFSLPTEEYHAKWGKATDARAALREWCDSTPSELEDREDVP